MIAWDDPPEHVDPAPAAPVAVAAPDVVVKKGTPVPKGFFKDARGKRSYGRLLLSGLMLCFAWMLFHDIYLVNGNLNPPMSNAAWQAWGIAFAALTTVVFGKDALDLWKNGGLTAIAAVAGATRDKLGDVVQRREKAAKAGEPGTEYVE